jgi:hypothetical protein
LSSPIEIQQFEQAQLDQQEQTDGDDSRKQGTQSDHGKKMSNPAGCNPPKKISELIEKFNVQPKFEVSPPFPDRNVSKLLTRTDSQDAISLMSPSSIHSHESQSDEIIPGLSSANKTMIQQSSPVGDAQQPPQSPADLHSLHRTDVEGCSGEDQRTTAEVGEVVPISVKKLVTNIESTASTAPLSVSAERLLKTADAASESDEVLLTTTSKLDEESSESVEFNHQTEADCQGIDVDVVSEGPDSSGSSQHLANKSEPNAAHVVVSFDLLEENDNHSSDSSTEDPDDDDDRSVSSSARRLRHTKSLGERTHGNRLSAPVSVFGRRRQASEHEVLPATPPKRDENGMLIPSNELAKYIHISRSQSLPAELEVSPTVQLSPRAREEMILKKEPFKSFRKLIHASEEEDLPPQATEQGREASLDSAEG